MIVSLKGCKKFFNLLSQFTLKMMSMYSSGRLNYNMAKLSKLALASKYNMMAPSTRENSSLGKRMVWAESFTQKT
jgi:hypothetical protein